MSDTAKREAVLARYNANGWGYPYTEQMADRIVELEAAVERVRALHDGERRHVGWIDVTCCRECSDDDNTYAYPCPPSARWRGRREQLFDRARGVARDR